MLRGRTLRIPHAPSLLEYSRDGHKLVCVSYRKLAFVVAHFPAYVAEAWYHLNVGTDPADLPDRIVEIAAAVKAVIASD